MLRLTRLDGNELFLNADLVACVESRRTTLVTLVDGTAVEVAEPAGEVAAAFTRYRASVLVAAERLAAADLQAGPAAVEARTQADGEVPPVRLAVVPAARRRSPTSD